MVFRSLVVAGLSVPSILFAQSKFEGVVTARMGSASRGSNATYSLKGDKVRVDVTGATGVTVSLLHDPSHSLEVMLMHQQKMVLDVATMGTQPPNSSAKKLALKWTGKKETIAGRECEHAIVGSDGSGVDVCLAKGMGTFAMAGGTAGGQSSDTPDVLSQLGANAFPLKATDVKRGVTIFLVTKIEKKPLDDALFAIPAGYQKIDMGRRGRPGL